MNKSVKVKYRPVLTAVQIERILALAKLALFDTSIDSYEVDISIISTLAPFQAKIENEGIQAAYTTLPAAPKTSILESIGGEAILPTEAASVSLSKEEYWYNCFNKWVDTPELCSLQEIAAAQEHRYLNDLMSTEEIEHFESAEDSFASALLNGKGDL